MNKSEIAEKAATKFCEEIFTEHNPGLVAEWKKRLASVVEGAIAESQAWISVEEKLPRPNVRVLVFAKNIFTGKREMLSRLDWHWLLPTTSALKHEVTHWMSLPKPPKGNENV